VDDNLIDLKTTIKSVVEVDMMRQLAGYAALQSIGGLRIGSSLHTAPFVSVALYYARYGVTAQWPMEELFPGDGFQRFCAVIREAVDTSRR
jgi:hypothetical protein